MEHRDHDDSVRFRAIQDDVWKRGNERHADVAMHNRVMFRIIRQAVQRLTNSRYEGGSQTGPLVFVPLSGVEHFPLCLGQQPDRATHRGSRASASARAWSAGIAASGLAACAASRRSISARAASESSGPAPRA